VILPDEWSRQACIVYDVAEPEHWFDAIPEFKTEKRRREWLLSRIAEKELRKRGVTGDYVSYSHSREFGAAAIGESPIGIDVEVVRTVPSNAAHLFLTAEEEAQAARCEIDDVLLHFWAAKEARWKQLGGAIPTLKRVPLLLVAELEDGLLFDYVLTQLIGEIVVALTRPIS
jgi:phosphopantetheinyl transferase (holo-ACP synthase)